MTATVSIYPSPYEITSAAATIEEVEEEISVLQWWEDKKIPGERAPLCVLNSQELPMDEWPSTMISEGDELGFVKLPGTGFFIGALIVALLVAAVVFATIEVPSIAETQNPDPVFNLSAAKNSVRIGGATEQAYGESIHHPSYAAQVYSYYEGNEQFQNSLYFITEGSADFVDVKVANTPLLNFPGVSVKLFRPGELMDFFPDNVAVSREVNNIRLYGPNEELFDDWSIPVRLETTGLIEKIQVDLGTLAGLFSTSKKGSLRGRTVTAEIQYRTSENGAWISFPLFSRTLATKDAHRWTVEQAITLRTELVEIRVRRSNSASTGSRSQDTLTWLGARAFAENVQDYGDCTLYAVKARTSNALNDNTSTALSGKIRAELPIWNPVTREWSEPQFTRNPVWAFCHNFRAKSAGNLADEFLDIELLELLSHQLHAEGITFDYVFTDDGGLWERARVIMSGSHGLPVMNGPLISAYLDRPALAQGGMFTPHNIVKDSFQLEYSMGLPSDHDGIQVEYFDEETEAVEPVDCLIGTDLGRDLEKIRLRGVTNRLRAYRWGMRMRARQILLRKHLSLSTGLEGKIYQYGDVLSVSHPLPLWGQSGLILGKEGLTVKLTDAVVFSEDGGPHFLSLRDRRGGARGPYEVTPGNNATEVILTEAVPDEYFSTEWNEEDVFYQFGPSEEMNRWFKVTSITPSEGDEVGIGGVIYDPGVYAFDEAPEAPPRRTLGSPPVGVPLAPVVANFTVTQSTTNLLEADLSWDAAPGAFAYVIETSDDGVIWESVATVSDGTDYVLAVTPGTLHVRIAGLGAEIGPYQVFSGALAIATVLPDAVTGLQPGSAFVAEEAEVTWTASPQAESYRVEIRGVTSGNLLRTETVTMTSLIYDYEMHLEDVVTEDNAERSFTFTVIAVNVIGDSPSAEITVSNPVPPQVTGLTATKVQTLSPGLDQYQVQWNEIDEDDGREYRLYGSAVDGFTAGSGNELYADEEAATLIEVPTGADYYLRAGGFDVWGEETTLSVQVVIAAV